MNRKQIPILTLAFVLILSSLSQIGCTKESVESSITKAVVGASGARQALTVAHNFKRLDDASYVAKLNLFRRLDVDLDRLANDLAALPEITPGNKGQIIERVLAITAIADSLAISVGFNSSAYTSSMAALRAGLHTLKSILNAVQKPTPVRQAWIDQIRTREAVNAD